MSSYKVEDYFIHLFLGFWLDGSKHSFAFKFWHALWCSVVFYRQDKFQNQSFTILNIGHLTTFELHGNLY